MARKVKKKPAKRVETLIHDEATRPNIPTAEYQSVLREAHQTQLEVAYERRNEDLDPQLVWRGKDQQESSELVVHAPPLFIQEKVHPKVLIDDLLRRSQQTAVAASGSGFQADLFADFNGITEGAAKTEFYQHEANWTNRMILGDSLQAMASLTEREGLRGKVQCIYIDPPYGIKFNSNFQWSTTSREVKDGNPGHITREPEQVRAFRDTWKDGVHSYLTYLRDRLVVARDLLRETGSIFVQIGDENVHRVRAIMDEVFGEANFVSQIFFRTTSGSGGTYVGGTGSYLLFYARSKAHLKYRQLFVESGLGQDSGNRFTRVQTHDFRRRPMNSEERRRDPIALSKVRVYRHGPLTSQSGGSTTSFEYSMHGITFRRRKGFWKTNREGMERLYRAWRLGYPTRESLAYVRFINDFPVTPISELWTDTQSGAFTDEKRYVVQTNKKVIERCLLMTTDPGDLVLDPTCGSGTTAYVAEQWGRRWITVDTSRVALALARFRVMGARYPYYLLADSADGQAKQAEITHLPPSEAPTHGQLRQGFVYQRVPHIMLRSITTNAEIDVIWEEYQEKLEPLRRRLNDELDEEWEEWQIPRDAGETWSRNIKKVHAEWWEGRIERQQRIDASIVAKADSEHLLDKPYEQHGTVRVAGPFTVESLSPHRTLGVDDNEELIDSLAEAKLGYRQEGDFGAMILENLRSSGVQQAHREDKIVFSSLAPWPGKHICGEGRYLEDKDGSATERRAAIFIGSEFGTVSRPDLVEAAREAGDSDFDVLIVCAFNYDAHSSEFDRLGRIPILKARMNADLHMANDLKNTGKGNLFVIFGEPDIEVLPVEENGKRNGQIQVKVNGVDVFHPSTGEVRSDGAEGIACWFVDTDYNEESFFVRHAYFLGAGDPYKSLKTTLKAEINAEAWETLHSDTSRPFDKPKSGRIAVKVINHLGDEVMKVYRVE